MADEQPETMSRRELMSAGGKATVASIVFPPFLQEALSRARLQQAPSLAVAAGVDRIVMAKGKTYLNGWAGYGEPPRRGRRRHGTPPSRTR